MSTPTAIWARAAGVQHRRAAVRAAETSALTLNMVSPWLVQSCDLDNLGHSIIQSIATGKLACGEDFERLGAVPDGSRAIRKLPEFAELRPGARLSASVSPLPRGWLPDHEEKQHQAAEEYRSLHALGPDVHAIELDPAGVLAAERFRSRPCCCAGFPSGVRCRSARTG